MNNALRLSKVEHGSCRNPTILSIQRQFCKHLLKNINIDRKQEKYSSKAILKTVSPSWFEQKTSISTFHYFPQILSLYGIAVNTILKQVQQA
ncbi:MAG: hypothetical protein QNJ41_19355 [Xenococcaceae cyanobacterium MO_188.B32]|nr:hypothetical protein [Xenococcaceae cyanobacterium MO_188.B32]